MFLPGAGRAFDSEEGGNGAGARLLVEDSAKHLPTQRKARLSVTLIDSYEFTVPSDIRLIGGAVPAAGRDRSRTK